MLKTLTPVVLLTIGILTGCSSTTEAPPVAGNIRTSLDQAGIKGVSVAQDRDKGVVTLSGQVSSDADKARAMQIAQSLAANQVVANELAILPPGDTSQTKTLYADLDKGIDSNLDAALISSGYKKNVNHSVKNGVVTLTGTVDTESQRTQLQSIAQGVPNTQQVVNEVQTRHEKATSTNQR